MQICLSSNGKFAFTRLFKNLNLCRFRFLNRLHFTFSLNTAHVALRFTFWFYCFKSFLWRRWCTNRVAVIIIPVAFSFKYKKYYQYWAHHACVYLCYYSKTQWMGLTTWPVVLFFVEATNMCCWIDTDTHTVTHKINCLALNSNASVISGVSPFDLSLPLFLTAGLLLTGPKWIDISSGHLNLSLDFSV